MRTRFLIIVMISYCIFSHAQCPLANGLILTPKQISLTACFDETIYKIQSKSDKVLSISDGVVSKILNQHIGYTVIVRRKNDDFFIYLNLDRVFFKVNDTIRKDQMIALASQKENDKDYLLEFQFWKKTQPFKVDLNCTKPN